MNSKKSKKGFNATSDLLNVHYPERPTMSTTTPLQSNRKSTSKHGRNLHSISASQFLQANFKFIISPLSDPKDGCFYSPDVMTSWENVECVIVSISQEHSLTCPICLDNARVPKITKCGHSFCYTCILRHLESDSTKSSTCPMCSCYIRHNELKSVKFHAQNIPKLNEYFEFNLLGISKSTLFPFKQQQCNQMINTSSSACINLSDIVPLVSDNRAAFSRVTFASVEYILELFDNEILELLRYRNECLDSSSSLIKAIPNPLTHVGQAKSPIPHVDTTPVHALTSMSTVWNNSSSKASTQLFSSSSSSPNTTRQTTIPISPPHTYNENIVSQADVECLPYITLAIDDIQNKRATFLSKVSNSTSTLASPVALPVKSSTNTLLPQYPQMPTVLSDVITFYQASNGDLIFLHPLCNKCIRTASTDTDISATMIITSKVVDIESMKVTPEVRQRIPYLRHLPAYCDVLLVEIDVRDIVSEEVYKQFEGEFQKRAQRRKEMSQRKKLEKKKDNRVRVQELQRIEALKLGSLMAEQEREFEIAKFLQEAPDISSVNVTTEDTNVQSENVSEAILSSPPISNWSFSKIAQMGGHFPTLGESQSHEPSAGSVGDTAASGSTSVRKAPAGNKLISSSLKSITMTVQVSDKDKKSASEKVTINALGDGSGSKKKLLDVAVSADNGSDGDTWIRGLPPPSSSTIKPISQSNNFLHGSIPNPNFTSNVKTSYSSSNSKLGANADDASRSVNKGKKGSVFLLSNSSGRSYK